MEEKFEVIDQYFCSICNRHNLFLKKWQRAFIEVYHSRGLIGNGGFHSYLCSVGLSVKIIIDAHKFIGLNESGELIQDVMNLWLEYGGDKIPDLGDPDEFRTKFKEDIDRIESKYYELEKKDFDCLYDILKKRRKIKS